MKTTVSAQLLLGSAVRPCELTLSDLDAPVVKSLAHALRAALTRDGLGSLLPTHALALEFASRVAGARDWREVQSRPPLRALMPASPREGGLSVAAWAECCREGRLLVPRDLPPSAVLAEHPALELLPWGVTRALTERLGTLLTAALESLDMDAGQVRDRLTFGGGLLRWLGLSAPPVWIEPMALEPARQPMSVADWVEGLAFGTTPALERVTVPAFCSLNARSNFNLGSIGGLRGLVIALARRQLRCAAQGQVGWAVLSVEGDPLSLVPELLGVPLHVPGLRGQPGLPLPRGEGWEDTLWSLLRLSLSEGGSDALQINRELGLALLLLRELRSQRIMEGPADLLAALRSWMASHVLLPTVSEPTAAFLLSWLEQFGEMSGEVNLTPQVVVVQRGSVHEQNLRLSRRAAQGHLPVHYWAEVCLSGSPSTECDLLVSDQDDEFWARLGRTPLDELLRGRPFRTGRHAAD